MKRFLFVGGPDSGRFISNYFNVLSKFGLELKEHWPKHAERKTSIPSGVDVIFMNTRATTRKQVEHVTSLAAGFGLPVVDVGSNPNIAARKAAEAVSGVHWVEERAAARQEPVVEVENKVTENQDMQKKTEVTKIVISGDSVSKVTYVSEEGRVKSSKPVLWNGQSFMSLKEMARAAGSASSTVSEAMSSGDLIGGFEAKPMPAIAAMDMWPDADVVDEADTRGAGMSLVEEVDGRISISSPGSRRKTLLVFKGEVVTAEELGKRINVHPSTIRSWARKPGGSNGCRLASVEEAVTWFPSAGLWKDSDAETDLDSDLCYEAAKAAVVKKEDSGPAAEVAAAVTVQRRPETSVSMSGLFKGDCNFLALTLDDGRVTLVPISESALVLMPKPRLFPGVDGVKSIFPSGVMWAEK